MTLMCEASLQLVQSLVACTLVLAIVLYGLSRESTGCIAQNEGGLRPVGGVDNVMSMELSAKSLHIEVVFTHAGESTCARTCMFTS